MDKVLQGDAVEVLREMRPDSVQTCVTSPPYYSLRDYGEEGQIGLEETPEEYVEKLVEVFRGVREVLRDNGTLWLNLGDTYSQTRWNAGEGQPMNKNKDTHRSLNADRNTGLPPKNLIGIPWKVAFALQADGWILRQDIIWNKSSCMPEPVKDRCTKAHEYIFLFSKQPKYYYNHEAIMTPAKQDYTIDPGGHEDTPTESAAHGMNQRRGSTSIKFGGNKYGDSDDPAHATKSGNLYQPTGYANKRSVWTMATARYAEAHFATFPEELAETCILAGSAVGDLVLDPFSGAATTGVVAIKNLRGYVGIELNPEYVEMSQERLDAADSQNRIFA